MPIQIGSREESKCPQDVNSSDLKRSQQLVDNCEPRVGRRNQQHLPNHNQLCCDLTSRQLLPVWLDVTMNSAVKDSEEGVLELELTC